jgi:hypothetical protein
MRELLSVSIYVYEPRYNRHFKLYRSRSRAPRQPLWPQILRRPRGRLSSNALVSAERVAISLEYVPSWTRRTISGDISFCAPAICIIEPNRRSQRLLSCPSPSASRSVFRRVKGTANQLNPFPFFSKECNVSLRICTDAPTFQAQRAGRESLSSSSPVEYILVDPATITPPSQLFAFFFLQLSWSQR